MLKAPTGSIEIRHGNVKTFKKWGLLWKLGGGDYVVYVLLVETNTSII